jgi:hypothetical protein
VYLFAADTFVPTTTTASTHVRALAWTPDGQSYFASGDQLINYSTCDDQYQPPQSPTKPLAGNPINLDTTAIGGVPHAIGLSLSDSLWYDYSVTTTAQAGNPAPAGNVCKSTVTINPPVTTASTLPCTARQVSFSPTREREFVTGVDPACANPKPVIYGYDVIAQQEITLTTTNPVIPLSGGVLNDGRKLYIGTYDGATMTALLHRIDLATDTEDVVTVTTGTPPNTVTTVTIPASVKLIPSFVAVVPK